MIGAYHCCDGCGFRFKDRNPDGCPNCKRGTHWLATFHFPEQAEGHRPLLLTTTTTEAP